MAKKHVDGGALLLGTLVAERRHACGWTRKELARIAGLSADAIFRIEQGTRGANLLTVAKLAAAFGVPISVFLAPISEKPKMRRPVVERIARMLDEQPDEIVQHVAKLIKVLVQA